jgi:hypothetical protein
MDMVEEPKCPVCGEPVIQEHQDVQGWGGAAISETVSYHCSSGEEHLPMGWKPEDS